jgi:hypothetical protein
MFDRLLTHPYPSTFTSYRYAFRHHESSLKHSKLNVTLQSQTSSWIRWSSVRHLRSTEHLMCRPRLTVRPSLCLWRSNGDGNLVLKSHRASESFVKIGQKFRKYLPEFRENRLRVSWKSADSFIRPRGSWKST